MKTFRPMFRWHHVLFVTSLILLLAALGAPAAAQPPPDAPSDDAPAPMVEADADSAVAIIPDPAHLVFSGAAGDALGRTLTLKAVGGAVSNVYLSAGDLLGDPGQQALLASMITITPAEVAAIDDAQTITVTVATNNVRGGVYRGALSIWYDELPNKTIPLTVAVEVTVIGVPAVSVDANSANQTLFAETRGAPFIGGAPTSEPRPLRVPFSDLAIAVHRPIRVPFFDVEIDPRAPVLGRLPVALAAGNNEPARVTGAEVLPVRNSASQLTLPSGVVSVDPKPSSSEPVDIPGQGAATLNLILSGRNLPAGTYTGNLRVWVENQSQVITVPFTMKLKDNWIYAIAVLAASFVVGAAVAWFNGPGNAARANIGKIRKLQRQLEPERNALENHLQKAELIKASDFLVKAMNAVRDEEGQNAIDARLKEFEDHIRNEVEEIGKKLKELGDLKSEIAASSKTDAEKASLEKKRKDLLANVERGALDSRAAAEVGVQAIRDALSPPAQTGFTDGSPADLALRTPQQAFDRFELKIRVGTALVMLLTYLFALLVGWAALYLSNQTFGAPQDYLTLFLWGATVNVIAGQQIKLENIYGHKAKTLPSSEGDQDTMSNSNANNGS